MKPVLKFLFFTAALLLGINAHAIPAKKGIVTVTQADGTSIEVLIKGDESGHIYTTPDGRPLEWIDGMLCLSDKTADLLTSRNILPHRKLVDSRAGNLQSGFPGLMPGSAFPLTGSPRALVILVDYADVTMTTDNPHDYFSRMLTQPGFSDYNATGSALDYFTENSRGLFTPQFDVIGPVKLTRNQSYYGANIGPGGADSHPEEMILEACQLVDGEVDFSVYDTDLDGRIDNVFVFYAGRGENDGGGAQTVWPHASNVTNIGEYRFDGVLLDYYACTNEWQGNRPDGIGTFIHEFSHVMGLPDFYATDYTSSFTPGEWSVMDAGAYCNNSRTPPGYSAYERYSLGWLTPAQLSEYSDVTLLPNTFNAAAIANVSETEFYILENRRRTGWDAYIPGEGMLIWHIDYDPEIWYQNTVNNVPTRQRVDLIEADGVLTGNTRSGDAFPGSAGITAYAQGGLDLSDIAEDGDFITFKNATQSTQATVAAPTGLAAHKIDETSFRLAWEAVADTHYFITVAERDNDDETVLDNVYAGHDGQFSITGLQPLTSYAVSLLAVKGLAASALSEPMVVTTADVAWEKRHPNATAATEVANDSFVANWEMWPEADSYILDVYTYVPGATATETLDFSDGTQSLPAGWYASTTSSYNMSSWAGKSAPSLRLGNDGDYIEFTGKDNIESLSFWHRGNGTGNEDLIIVSKQENNEWTEIKSYPITTTTGGATLAVDDIDGNTRGLRITFRRSKGSLAIDDITVSYPGTPVRSSIDGYPVTTQATGSHKVSGLQPGEYFYRIKAVCEGVESLESDEIAVGQSSSAILPVSTVNVIASGLDIHVSGLADGTHCMLLNMLGRCVTSVTAVNTECHLSAPTPGAYILKTGNDINKIILK